MKKLFSPLPLSLLFLTNLLVCCSQPRAIEYRDFKNFKVENIGFSSSAVKLDMVYFNPNNFGLQLKSTELDIFVDNILLGHSSQDYQISIPRQQEFAIPILVNLDMKNLLANGLNTFFKKEVTVRVTGYVKVGKANVFINFPINYEGKQSFSVF